MYDSMCKDPLVALEYFKSFDDILIDFNATRKVFNEEPSAMMEESQEDWIEWIDDFGRTRIIKKNLLSESTTYPNAVRCDLQAKGQHEIREKSVGYYKLSVNDPLERARQLDDLEKLHNETNEVRLKTAFRKQQKYLLRESRLLIASKRRTKGA